MGRDIHEFAIRIYNQCGKHDLVGNHVPSFFINEGTNFTAFNHAAKFEASTRFPTGALRLRYLLSTSNETIS